MMIASSPTQGLDHIFFSLPMNQILNLGTLRLETIVGVNIVNYLRV